MPRVSTSRTKASGGPSKRTARKPQLPAKARKLLGYIDPRAPYPWRDTSDGYPNDNERAEAIKHIVRCLSQGGVELCVILWHMVPRVSKASLFNWRKAHPEWDEEIEEAFETGCAMDVMKTQEISDGLLPITYGHTTKEERAKYRAEARRDRLRVNNIWKRVEAINRRYKPRTIMEGDEDHPLQPSVYQMMPTAVTKPDPDE